MCSSLIFFFSLPLVFKKDNFSLSTNGTSWPAFEFIRFRKQTRLLPRDSFILIYDPFIIKVHKGNRCTDYVQFVSVGEVMVNGLAFFFSTLPDSSKHFTRLVLWSEDDYSTTWATAARMWMCLLWLWCMTTGDLLFFAASLYSRAGLKSNWAVSINSVFCSSKHSYLSCQ